MSDPHFFPEPNQKMKKTEVPDHWDKKYEIHQDPDPD